MEEIAKAIVLYKWNNVGIIIRMSPDVNKLGSPVACRLPSPAFNPVGRCLSQNRVVPKFISRRLPIDHPGTYGSAVSAPFILRRPGIYPMPLYHPTTSYPLPGYHLGPGLKNSPF